MTSPTAAREPAAAHPGTVSDPRVLHAARRHRALVHALEIALYTVVAGSALAIGAVHPWAYVPLWASAVVVAVLVVLHGLSTRDLRHHLGARRVAFHVGGRWLVVEPDGDDAVGWEFDLSRPWPRGPLFWPGVVFLAWAIVQIAPLPGAIVHVLSPGRGHLSMAEVHGSHPLSLDVLGSVRGLAFVLALIVFHTGAAALAAHNPCRRRFRRFAAGLGTALALIALVQIAVSARRIYGLFQPLESYTFFGSFVNRNHFAAYMTLCAMAALAILYRALRGYVGHLGGRRTWRRRLLALGHPEGVGLLRAVVPVLLIVGALVATTSRGGILAFAGALLLAATATRRHQHGLPVTILAFLLLLLPVGWFGWERLELRFGRLHAEPGRAVVWRHSLASMSGTWLTGSGLNTFGEAISRVPAFAMPAGATGWPDEVGAAAASGVRVGHRTPADLEDWQWYREAHNDYIQLAVEMGLVGFGIGLWAMIVLALRMREPWLAAGVAGLLAHSTVDFSLQIPAVAVLFVVMCAYAERTSSAMRPA